MRKRGDLGACFVYFFYKEFKEQSLCFLLEFCDIVIFL